MSANLYFDNATTSYPKPREMREALARFYDLPIGSYGRSCDEETLRMTVAIEQLRDDIARWFGTEHSDHICFTENATYALNTILRGFSFIPNQRVLISAMEHNAVMRPLTELAKKYSLKIEILPSCQDGKVDLDQLESFSFTNVGLIILNYGSNVNGLIQPIESFCRLIRKKTDAPLLVDATQLSYSTILKADEWGIDAIAFTGHKGLLGPSGTGGFFLRTPELVRPLSTGGNGTASESFENPQLMPDKFTAGTPNSLGLFALSQAVKYHPCQYNVSQDFWWQLISKVKQISSSFRLLHAYKKDDQSYLFSLVHSKASPSELMNYLRERHGILARGGLMCTPLAHQTLGTFPYGALRISLSPFHQEDDLNNLFAALVDTNHYFD